jgi:GT2 family glycosyltransferase
VSTAAVDVLIPTRDRPAALAATLATLIGQTRPPLRIVVADQGDRPALEDDVTAAVVRVLELRGVAVEAHRRPGRRGMAEQRAFLLSCARAPYALFVDDDVLLAPNLLARLVAAITEQRCGFVGCGLIGPTYRDEERPDEQQLQFWQGPVEPERITPGGPEWARHRLHSAANLLHAARQLGLDESQTVLYRVAWVGGCVLYDVAALLDAGGFDFWPDLPPAHAGEDVLAQLRVLGSRGGCAILPSGAYHQELPTTVGDRAVDAPFALEHLLAPAAADARRG